MERRADQLHGSRLSSAAPSASAGWRRFFWLAIIAWLGLCGAVSAAEITFNVREAEISKVTEMVAEVTGKNFVVDPRVKGKVTVVSSHAMAPEEVYQVFLAILQVHGYAAVPAGSVVKIIPVAEAKQSGPPNATDEEPGEGDELVTRVLQVQNVAADQLVPILRPLVPQQGHLAAYPPTNVLIISDWARNIERLVSMIERIDQVSDNEVEVAPLNNAVASEVVRVLTALTQGDNAAKGNDPHRATFVADERTNSVLISGDRGKRLMLRALIAHLDTPTPSEGNTDVIYLHYAKAETLAGILKGVSATLTKAPGGKAAASQAREIGIESDEFSNALVITAPPDVMRELRNVIRRLDIRRAQVQVEAVIAEVSSASASELGIQWMADNIKDGQGSVGMINLTGGRLPTLDGLSGGLLTVDTGSDFSALGYSKVVGETLKFGALVRALATDANTNILSTPTLVTLDNEEAEIIVGENRPFLTGSYTSIGNTGSTPTNPFQTIERQDVGLTLTVKPQINEGDTVRLEVKQEVSSVVPSTANTTEVVTNKRSIKTSVLVEDGQVIVLGGLIDDQLQEGYHKVPLVGDLPVLGNLFKYQEANKTKRNLMVFLHPRILRDGKMEAAVTGGKYSYMRQVQQATWRRGFFGGPRQQPPTLEPIESLVNDVRTEQQKGARDGPERPGSAPSAEPAKPAGVPGHDWW